jgi:transcriptional regulator with XRE-family HTH domain
MSHAPLSVAGELRRRHACASSAILFAAVTHTEHRTLVGRVERGENQVTLETLCRLAAALDVTPSHLVERLPYRSTATGDRRA